MTYAPFNLAGKVCVITGGNKGIGLGMAEALAASNADVVIWGRKEDDNAAALKKLEGLGTGKASSKKVDVAEEDQIVKKSTVESIPVSPMPGLGAARPISMK